MLTIHTNTLSLITQRNLAFSSQGVKTSIERLSTGFKINRAADNASNLSISKKMNCQISGTNVAQENTAQAIGLLDTADGTLDEMTKIANRIRDLSLQSMNGTYSDEERSMMQEEVNKLTLEMYRQRNSAKYNELDIFGKKEYLNEAITLATTAFSGGGSLEALSSGVFAASMQVTGANIDPTTLGPQGNVGTYEVEKLTEEEALAQGYTVIKTVDELKAMGSSGKYILMNDIDLSGVDWTAKTLNAGAEFNGNGYTISNLTINASGAYYTGFFSQNAGTIKNLNITNADVLVNGVCGVLVFSNNASGKIENCSVSGKIKASAGVIAGVAAKNYGEIANTSADCIVEAGFSGAVFVGENYGVIENSSSSGKATNADGFVGRNSGTIENASSSVNVTNGSGFVGTNTGTIHNATASGNTTTGSGFAGTNSGTIENASASGNVTVNGSGFVGTNSGTIRNATASGNVTGTGNNGGFVGNNSGANALIENCSASGNVSSTGSKVGGFAGAVNGVIKNSYSLGAVSAINVSNGYRVGGFAGNIENATIINCYGKGNVENAVNEIGGFIGRSDGSNNVIYNCYTTSEVTNLNNSEYAAGFIGRVEGQINVFNSYCSGVVNSTNSNAGAFIGNRFINNANIENCYSNLEQAANIKIEQAGVSAMHASWFEDGYNLQFLGDAYDYYYNPPELWGNGEAHPEEFTQFQVGANSGLRNQLDMNLQFRMYNFYGDVTSVESASDTLERVDAFKERLSEHRSMIGSVRNRLDSVLESQSIRLENLNSSHSTIVDTDFAAETAALTRNQILQQATTSLLSQANFMPNIALQLLS